jgi:hypothetical protein
VRLVPRLASPVGFGLALLFFLLPFVAVSCEAPGLGSVEITYTGVDLATGGKASVDTVGDVGSVSAPPVQDNEDAPQPDVQVLAIVTVALLAIGLGVSLAPLVARTRLLGAGGAAVLGGALLIVTEAVARSNLSSALREAAAKEVDKPGDVPFNLSGSLLDDMVRTRIGFWLSLTAVILVLLFNAGVFLWPRIRAATQPTPAD